LGIAAPSPPPPPPPIGPPILGLNFPAADPANNNALLGLPVSLTGNMSFLPGKLIDLGLGPGEPRRGEAGEDEEDGSGEVGGERCVRGEGEAEREGGKVWAVGVLMEIDSPSRGSR
jgi:hypothetical protein